MLNPPPNDPPENPPPPPLPRLASIEYSRYPKAPKTAAQNNQAQPPAPRRINETIVKIAPGPRFAGQLEPAGHLVQGLDASNDPAGVVALLEAGDANGDPLQQVCCQNRHNCRDEDHELLAADTMDMHELLGRG